MEDGVHRFHSVGELKHEEVGTRLHLLILGVYAPLTVFCDTFSVITSAASFQE